MTFYVLRRNTLSNPLPHYLFLNQSLPKSIYHISFDLVVQLEQVTSEAIDMASLIRFPAGLFLSRERMGWSTVERRKETRRQRMRRRRHWGFGQPDGQGASEYLAFCDQKSSRGAGAGPELGWVCAGDPRDAAVRLGPRSGCHRGTWMLAERTGHWSPKSDSEDKEGEEDARLRELRLNLLALAKRAPLDKIQRLPAELVPEHIRHFVPTVAPLSL